MLSLSRCGLFVESVYSVEWLYQNSPNVIRRNSWTPNAKETQIDRIPHRLVAGIARMEMIAGIVRR